MLTGAMIVVFWANTGAGATATGVMATEVSEATGVAATGANLAAGAGAGATATPGVAQRGGAGPGAGVVKFAPGTVGTAGAFLVLLLRGMMKICLWLWVSVLLVVGYCGYVVVCCRG